MSDRLVKGIVKSVALGTSSKQNQPEVMLRVLGSGDVVMYPRISLSTKPITRGANTGRTMTQVSTDRLALVLGTEAKPSSVIGAVHGLEGKPCQVVMKTYVNPETGVESEGADSVIFEGESAPTMNADAFLALLA